MPELPEVEVVRRGLHRWVAGRRIAAVQVHHDRAVRRHAAGAADLVSRLVGVQLGVPRRRGKFLWFPLDSGDALVAHLGMSGQLLVGPAAAAPQRHLRVGVSFVDGDPQLRFVDQRTFGWLAVDPGGAELPGPLAHIARDPMDPELDGAAVLELLRRRRGGLKRALLDQTLISGIGNIYADELLWRLRLHWDWPAAALPEPAARRLFPELRQVMSAALAAGGTTFDALYVNVNGASGYFDRALAAYGRQDRPCPRCGTPIVREPFMNRSSFRCPRCQPPYRPAAGRPTAERPTAERPTVERPTVERGGVESAGQPPNTWVHQPPGA